jgi:uncharacterized protein
MDNVLPYWRRKTLAQMTRSEWERLCDGCGRCCLNKLEDADTGEIFYTDVGCRLLDGHSCHCRNYKNRHAEVDNCDHLTPTRVPRLRWLPKTCAYRLIAEGRDLYWWHPLVSGDPDTIHAAGISVRGRVGAFEHQMGDSDLEDHVVSWPARIPASARRRSRPPRRSSPERNPASAPSGRYENDPKL